MQIHTNIDGFEAMSSEIPDYLKEEDIEVYQIKEFLKEKFSLKYDDLNIIILRSGRRLTINDNFVVNNDDIILLNVEERVKQKIPILRSGNDLASDLEFVLQLYERLNRKKEDKKYKYYEGDMIDGVPNGFGINKEKRKVYEGYWRNGLYHGSGKEILYSNGKLTNIREGEWKDGKLNGRGTVVKYEDGKISYIENGNFENGNLNGHGYYKSLLDGELYEGDFVDGLYHGFGKYSREEGISYIGYFDDGIYHNKGSLTYKNGNVYKGEFEHGTVVGYGEMKYANGDVYIGHWISKADLDDDYIYDDVGIKSGFGIMTYADGRIYKGEWIDDHEVEL